MTASPIGEPQEPDPYAGMSYLEKRQIIRDAETPLDTATRELAEVRKQHDYAVDQWRATTAECELRERQVLLLSNLPKLMERRHDECYTYEEEHKAMVELILEKKK